MMATAVSKFTLIAGQIIATDAIAVVHAIDFNDNDADMPFGAEVLTRYGNRKVYRFETKDMRDGLFTQLRSVLDSQSVAYIGRIRGWLIATDCIAELYVVQKKPDSDVWRIVLSTRNNEQCYLRTGDKAFINRQMEKLTAAFGFAPTDAITAVTVSMDTPPATK